MQKRRLIAGGLATLLLYSCAGEKIFVSNAYQSARVVAVLPMANESNDLDGPIYLRKIIFERLAERGYRLIPLDEIDAKLRDNGFTEGGQLKLATPQQIGQWLGADTLFYGTVENFDYILLGFYFQRRVTISGRLVEARSAERYWETEQGYSTRQVATNKKDAERLTAIELAAKTIEKAAHIPLRFESNAAVTRLLNTLPDRP